MPENRDRRTPSTRNFEEWLSTRNQRLETIDLTHTQEVVDGHTCQNCGRQATKNFEFNGRILHFCVNCFINHFEQCSHCGKISERRGNGTIRDPFRYIDGTTYCMTCFEELFWRCYNCYTDILCSEQEPINFRGHHICHNCSDHEIVECEECSNDILRSSSRVLNGNYYCDECYQEAREENQLVHDHDFKPLARLLSPTKRRESLYLGVELEVEGEGSSIAKSLKTFAGHISTPYGTADQEMYFKWDGSVDGVEIVTHPATLEYHKKKLQWKRLLHHLRTIGASSYKNGNCGLHVHLSRNFFKQQEIRKLRWFFSKCYTQIHELSQRSGKTDYCRKDNYGFEKFKSCNDMADTRYFSLNVLPRDTVEIRIFRGTLSTSSFLTALEFAEAVAFYVKTLSVARLARIPSWKQFEDFKEFVVKQNKYHNLVKKMEKNLCA